MNALFLNFLDYRELLPSTNDKQYPYSSFYILSFNMLDNAADNILNKLNILAFCAVQTTLLAWGEEISMSGGDLTEGRLIQ